MEEPNKNPAVIWQQRLIILQKVSELNYRELAQELGCSRGQLYKIREGQIKRPNLLFRKGLELLEKKYGIVDQEFVDSCKSKHAVLTQQERLLLNAYHRLTPADQQRYLNEIQQIVQEKKQNINPERTVIEKD